ncbi:MAG TPA: hypothetical protein VN822_05940 [Candidatus Acidoferrales bacterium]|nr:hypothetical protein [Candidatus Acidoferrales bacterium]
MPNINGRFYINPTHGQALEDARLADVVSQQNRPQTQARQDEGGH